MPSSNLRIGPQPVLQISSVYCKSSFKHFWGLIYFKHIWEGGSLIRTWGLCEMGEGLFNLAKKMVSVLHKELGKVEKLKYRSLEDIQPRIKNKSELQVGE